MMKVIYAGLVIVSGGADLTIWLLFGFVVCFFFPKNICKCTCTRTDTYRQSIHVFCISKSSFSLCCTLILLKSLNSLVVSFRCQTWCLQQQKHKGGTVRSSKITPRIGLPLFHFYTKAKVCNSLCIGDLSVKL